MCYCIVVKIDINLKIVVFEYNYIVNIGYYGGGWNMLKYLSVFE